MLGGLGTPESSSRPVLGAATGNISQRHFKEKPQELLPPFNFLLLFSLLWVLPQDNFFLLSVDKFLLSRDKFLLSVDNVLLQDNFYT